MHTTETVVQPPPPTVAVFPPPPPPLASFDFALGWLLDHASAPIQYRSCVDVARIGGESGSALSNLPYTFPPAQVLAMSQAADGVWNNAMLTLPPQRGDEFENVGTVHAVRRLAEYGWDKDSPPIFHARRTLFRLLADDNDPGLLFEFAPPAAKKVEPEMLLAIRQSLREAAAAALAQAGYESDPRLRGAANRVLERIFDFLRSPVAEKPWIRVGNRQVLAPEAAPPTVYALHMLAHMPLFRNEHFEEMEALYRWLERPLPRQEKFQLVGQKLMPVPLAVLGDELPHRNAVESDVPAALGWLELVARLGFLRRNENWLKMHERFIDDCGRDGVWHPHKGMAMPRSSNPWCWASYPLEPSHAGDERWTDVTFRVGLIAKLSGRTINVI
ncbi:MAG TPA: hypothetical protein VG916_05650 [Gemmatimonadaceae bacterium]|nr:hypothetical protein [Gemmatimonadaceae bacterium]